ncbi:cytochrome c oxidase assembly protein [Planosporangium thailandense]|uniref:cytochrome c oxidase assembly protein n=1 Tax=Planosporangium thailandense TaxID=765197 RepID=UPI003B839597
MRFPGDAVAVLAHGGEDPLPPLRAASLFHLDLDPLFTTTLAVIAIVYLYGVLRLERRGDRWPVLRTVAFLVPGLGGIASVTLTGVGTYDDTLLSVHMVQHMVLSMIAPIFLALGAPVTLALRTLPPGARRALLSVVHSRVVKIWTYPLFAYGLFVVTPFILYFTGLYRLTMENDLVHQLVHIHFIGVGCLFFWPLLGLDPLPGRWPYPGRALLMLLSTPFHVVLGLTVMQSTVLLGGDYYPSLHLDWANPWTDQRVAGGILWAGGEVVSVTVLAVLVVQWIRQSEREARRVDRQLDRQEAAANARAAASARAAAGTADAAEPSGDGSPEWTAPWWEQQGGYDPIGSRDTQGATSR